MAGGAKFPGKPVQLVRSEECLGIGHGVPDEAGERFGLGGVVDPVGNLAEGRLAIHGKPLQAAGK